ncbi:hypothetical protein OH809_27470 [Streptomyces sp. NBC_00873]|uniref:hypothetical protein n=1 Tax=unclassified Streptomyces TaxID=2593676 RepID=UPI003864A581|nr:hypothetical protein OH809_27470 [Streptomyces sp. NBC_00873]WTA43965.1 hypothetical protein OH821_16210 [Streptomyces sp. NBC_00842]
MRSIPLTFCGAAVIAATLIPAPAALADSGSDSGSGSGKDSKSQATLSVTPSSLAPGDDVDLQVDGCKGKEAKGISDAFASDARFTADDRGGLLTRARIRSDAAPGAYDITVTCDGDKDTRVSSTVTVVAGDRSEPLAPIAPVRAGGGGTAVLTEQPAEQDGPGTAHAVLGLALAALASVAVALRSARRRRRPAAD